MIDPSLVQGDPFNAPTPGQSLTDTPGQWGWEKPSIVSDPQQAYEGLVESLKGPVLKESLGKLMYIGVTIETLVSGLVKKGFAEGAFSPDVAELIKPALAFHLLKIANDSGITPKIVNKFPSEPINDGMTAQLLKQMNPKEYQKVMEKVTTSKEFKQVSPNEGFMPVQGVE